MSQWFLSYDGQQSGPFELAQAAEKARANPDGYAWREGFAEWVPISQVAELSQRAAPTAPPPAAAPRLADEIDFTIFG
ncbi:MAG: DUF4339 domain-containing protein, partial [Candidatus Omnitrophica bacterium]|nr:DUF4339 domain-containing protein [Candidatus Omnitrophota bacterium]